MSRARAHRQAARDPAPPARDLDGLLRRLHLPTVRRLYAELASKPRAPLARRPQPSNSERARRRLRRLLPGGPQQVADTCQVAGMWSNLCSAPRASAP